MLKIPPDLAKVRKEERNGRLWRKLLRNSTVLWGHGLCYPLLTFPRPSGGGSTLSRSLFEGRGSIPFPSYFSTSLQARSFLLEAREMLSIFPDCGLESESPIAAY